MAYQHIFFDLDHTLWDHERNSNETLVELYEHFELHKLEAFECPLFLAGYNKVNHELWRQYHLGEVDQAYIRDNRFELVLGALGIPAEQVPVNISAYYLAHAPLKTHVFPYTHELLEYLQSKYTLAIITNGFEDVQHTKINSAGLSEYFAEVITSDQAGCLKPDRNIFDFTRERLNALPGECIMVGDNLETDIAGARNAEIDQVFFNPFDLEHEVAVTHEIKHLKELEVIL